jgi:hypothetical protein
MTAATSFYQLLTTVSLTLLGLWFAVLGIAHGGWRDDPVRHRATLHIALLLLLPGVMGLASVLGGTNPVLWRTAFMLGGVVGVVEAVQFVRAPHRPSGVLERVLEGIATGLVFLAGIAHLWLAFAEAPPRPVIGRTHR